eukprot:gene7600-9051_t
MVVVEEVEAKEAREAREGQPMGLLNASTLHLSSKTTGRNQNPGAEYVSSSNVPASVIEKVADSSIEEDCAQAQVRRNADGSIELVDSGPPAKTEESYLTAAGTQMSLDDAKKILEAAKGLKKKKRKKDRNDKEDRKRRKKEKKEKHKKKKEKDKRKEEKKRKKKKKNHNSSDSASSGSSDSSDSGESDKEDGAPAENPKDNELPPDDFDVPKITAEDDYFAKNHEFSAWLRQEHDVVRPFLYNKPGF